MSDTGECPHSRGDETRLSLRRRTRATRRITNVVTYITVDARGDKPATVVDRIQLTTLSTIDVP